MDGACVEKQSWQIRASEYKKMTLMELLWFWKNSKSLREGLIDKVRMKCLLLARIEQNCIKNSVKHM